MSGVSAYIPPLIMAVLFVAVVRLIIVSQNPQKRAAARARELAAEQDDPRFAGPGRGGGTAAAPGARRGARGARWPEPRRRSQPWRRP